MQTRAKKRLVGLIAFTIIVLLLGLFIFDNSALYSQTPPFGYAVEGNPEFRAELGKKIRNILENMGFNVVSVTLSVKKEEQLDKTVIANINIILLKNGPDKTVQYRADIIRAITKEIPDIDNYMIYFTFNTSVSPALE